MFDMGEEEDDGDDGDHEPNCRKCWDGGLYSVQSETLIATYACDCAAGDPFRAANEEYRRGAT